MKMTRSREGTSKSILLICFLVLLLVEDGAMTEFANENCGGIIPISSSGGILKSQFMSKYGDNMDCTVTLSTNIGRKILLTFQMLDIISDPSDCESTDYVYNDYLEVFDDTTKETSLGVFCGSTTPSPITSTSNSITLTLKTDSSNRGDGYRLAYTSFTESSDAPCMSTEFECKNGRCISYHLKYNSDDNCGDKSDTGELGNHCGETIEIGNTGGTLDSQIGVEYQNNLDCTYTLSTSIGRKILLTFERLEIQGNPSDCGGQYGDYLEVFDDTTKVTSLGVFCGSTTPSPITSTSNSITLTLKTDNYRSMEGYFLAYTSFTESSDAPCTSDEFECKNGRCINASLKLNEYDNCGDNSDEEIRDAESSTTIKTDSFNIKSGFTSDNATLASPADMTLIGSMTMKTDSSNITSTSPADDISIDWFMSLFNNLLQWGIGVLVAIIIGIIVGVVLLCVCCGCICYHCCCKKRQQPQYTGVAQQPAIAMQPTGKQYDKLAQI